MVKSDDGRWSESAYVDCRGELANADYDASEPTDYQESGQHHLDAGQMADANSFAGGPPAEQKE
jgi:hypothetical protein